MRGSLPRCLLAGMAVIAFASSIRAQSEKWKIDAGHSHATFFLISSREPSEPRVAGIARSSGLGNLKGDNPSKMALRLSIYPEGEGETLLTGDDTFRKEALASLSYYSVLSFQSERCLEGRNGKLELAGELSVTHVTRASTAAWNNSYTGAQYVDPVKKTASREISLTIVTSGEAIATDEKVGLLNLLIVTDISREDFPELWTSLADSIWPAVVDDRNCAIPEIRASLRDYRGAICTGTVVGPAVVPADFASASAEKPEAADRSQPSGDKIRIVFQLRLKQPQ
jgi:polyisoprenoid-binding protein YceI